MDISEYLKRPTTFYELNYILRKKYSIDAYKLNDYEFQNDKQYEQILYILERQPIIIFLNSGQIGHWVALLKCKNYIEYYDSYGRIPPKYISKFLYYVKKNNKNISIEYNEHEMQGNSFVCGWFCVLRIVNNRLHLKKFMSFCKKLQKENNIPNYDILTYLYSQ